MGKDDLIRERAHTIWLAEGSPDGRHEQHWRQATEELAQARAEAGAGPDVVASPAPETFLKAKVAATVPKPRRRKAG